MIVAGFTALAMAGIFVTCGTAYGDDPSGYNAELSYLYGVMSLACAFFAGHFA